MNRKTLSNFAKTFKKAYSLIKTKKKVAGLDTTDKRDNYKSDLVDWLAINDHLKYFFSGLSKLLNSIFQVFVTFAPLLISISLSQNKKKIDYLTNII